MRSASVYIMADRLLQTRLPEDVYLWVEKQAAKEAESIAAWMRRTIMQAYNAVTIEAWVVSERRADPRMQAHRGHSHYLLERLAETEHQTMFALRHGRRMQEHAGKFVSDDAWTQSTAYSEPDAHRFLLAGSPHAWRLRSAHFNARLGRVELALAPERVAGGSPKKFAALGLARAFQDILSVYAGVTPSAYFMGAINMIEVGDDVSVDVNLPHLVADVTKHVPGAFANAAVSDDLRRALRAHLPGATPEIIRAASELLARVLDGDPATYARTWATVPAEK